MVKASSAAGQPVGRRGPACTTEPTDRTRPKASASPRLDRAARDRAVRGARHHGVDIGVVPHVERTGRAGADGDAQDGDERRPRDGCRPARATRPTERGEDHQRHHARLQQCADSPPRRRCGRAACPGCWRVVSEVSCGRRRSSAGFEFAAWRPCTGAPSWRGPVRLRRLLDDRQGLELVERRRRGQRPFQRRRALAPRIVTGHALLRRTASMMHIQEDQHATKAVM